LEEVKFPPIRTAAPLVAPQRDVALDAIEILKTAKRPMVMAGTSVKWSNAQSELAAFLEKTNIPAYTNGMGRGTLPRGSKHLFNRTRKDAIQNCNVMILAGCLLDFRMSFGRKIPADAKIIQMKMDSTLIGQNRSADVALVGNLASGFDTLSKVMDEEGIALDFSEYSAGLRAKENELEAQVSGQKGLDAVPIHTSRFCQDIAKSVEQDDTMIVIGDGGDVVAASAKVVPIPTKGLWMDPGPLGTLGVGAPFALAAQVTHPDRKVLIIYGDGSFGLNGFEFDTAVRFNLPIVGIVGNDAAWGQMMRPQQSLYGRTVATELNYTRYDKVVEAMGGHGEFVENPDDIIPALERAFASGKPALINVILRQDKEYSGRGYV
jgi:acetolactate synthase-1/2/3 large subunit